MQVTSGATTQHGQTLTVTLTEDDVRAYGVDLDSIKPHEKHRVMMQYADLMVVQYLMDAHLITPDYGVARREEIMARGK